MSLEFLNDVRSYDAARQSISFWGHDLAFEVTFRVDFTVLKGFAGLDTLTEPVALRSFDKNIDRVREAAKKLYKRTPKRYLELSAADI